MKEWQELGKELRRFINPETFPVAIRILKDKGEIPKRHSNSLERS